ncbi:transcription initiation factor TFIID subunit 9 [Hordeum vulgare]|nr:transcription initiation factor TFIID subunit 9 [Hordeum vulgare]
MYLAGTRLNHSAKASHRCSNRYFLSEKGDVISKPDSLPEIPPAKAPNTAVRPWTAAAAAGGASGPDEPCDARVVRELLRSTGLGEGEGEPRVVHQFLDLAYRYVGDVLGDAQVYADHAAKPQLDADDVRLAIQARVNFSFSQPPPREVLLELARSRNKIPLPKSIAPPGSIPLPPEQDTLLSENYQLLPTLKPPTPMEEAEVDNEGVDASPANPSPNYLQDQRGS